MTDQHTLDHVIAHLRTRVAELRRREREGAPIDELEDRRRLILRLQQQLAHSVVELLDGPAGRQLANPDPAIAGARRVDRLRKRAGDHPLAGPYHSAAALDTRA
jgi:hypothetical protein